MKRERQQTSPERARLLPFSVAFSEDPLPVFCKYCEQDLAQHIAADDFTDCYEDHEQRNREGDSIAESQNERNDHCVRDDRRERSEPPVTSQHICADGSEQSSDTAEYDVPDDCSACNVGNQASYEKSGYCGRCEKRKNR